MVGLLLSRGSQVRVLPGAPKLEERRRAGRAIVISISTLVPSHSLVRQFRIVRQLDTRRDCIHAIGGDFHMRDRIIIFIGSVAVTTGVICLASQPVDAQARKPAATTWTAPRTADGHPDLQGTYDVATMTPLERPAGIDRLVLTREEAAAMEKYEYERQVKNDAPLSGDRAAPPVGGDNTTPKAVL